MSQTIYCPHCGKGFTPQPPLDPKIAEIPVDELEFTVRVANVLYAEKIKTVGELAEVSQARLLRTQNFGRISLDEVKHVLSGLGVTLRKYDHD